MVGERWREGGVSRYTTYDLPRPPRPESFRGRTIVYFLLFLRGGAGGVISVLLSLGGRGWERGRMTGSMRIIITSKKYPDTNFQRKIKRARTYYSA